jgi:AcrR family transcriptional regulator
MSSDPLATILATAEERFDPYAERILEAARARLVQFGIRRTSLDDIATAAGVGRATLFRRFPNRDALMLAIVAREARCAVASVDAQITSIEDPEELLVVGALAVIREITGNELLQGLLATDPEQMLPLLTGKGNPILAIGTAYMAGQLQRMAAQGASLAGEPAVTSELLARLALSIALNPEGVVPLDDEQRMEQIVRATFVPMVLAR